MDEVKGESLLDSYEEQVKEENKEKEYKAHAQSGDCNCVDCCLCYLCCGL